MLTFFRIKPMSASPVRLCRSGKPRPAVLRALGSDDPPTAVEIENVVCVLKAVFKHDFWAATALYEGPIGAVVCKFHRSRRVGIVPMGWLGRWMAARERWFLSRFHDVAGVPGPVLRVTLNGRPVANAVARPYVPGHPIGRAERLPRAFFTRLEHLLRQIHLRNAAYVDLNKRENVLVADDGQPYLFDFQISFAVRRSHGSLDPLMWLLRLLQRSDLYHLQKLIAKHSLPDNDGAPCFDKPAPPWWIRLHRCIAVPFRELRRRLLVLLGVRTGKGRVTSEHFVEHGWRAGAAG